MYIQRCYDVMLMLIYCIQDEELKLSSEAAVSEVTSLMPALTVDKSDGAESTADSMLEAQSVFSEATSTERLTSSHVSIIIA